MGGDAPGLRAGEEIGRRSTNSLTLEMYVGQRSVVAIAHNEKGVVFLSHPRHRKAPGVRIAVATVLD